MKNRTWHCRGPVDLDLVRVDMTDTSKDAVHLDPGCTGTIRQLEIVGNGADLGPGGDGVKVHAGAHDLQILGGEIDCGRKRPHKHQDAIQAMGGADVTFRHIVSTGCANSFMFINTGNGNRGIPKAIRCEGCKARSSNYSVFIGASIESGAVGGVFTSRVRPKVTSEAVSPVLVDDQWKPYGERGRRISGA